MCVCIYVGYIRANFSTPKPPKSQNLVRASSTVSLRRRSCPILAHRILGKIAGPGFRLLGFLVVVDREFGIAVGSFGV